MKKPLVLTFLFFSLISYSQTWSSAGSGITNGPIYSLAAYNNYLYAGGYFNSVCNTPANNIAQWNGSVWSALGKGINGYGNPSVNVLFAGPNSLFVGGLDYGTADTTAINNIASWNGSTWSALGAGITQNEYFNDEVFAIDTFQSNLYVGGIFDTAGAKPLNNIAMWNGSTWSSVGGGIKEQVNAFMVYNGNLYVGGYFDSIGNKPANSIATWNGSTWSLISGFSKNGEITAFSAYKGNLIAAGIFDTIGGIAAHNIAMWNGSTWAKLGSGIDKWIIALAVYNGNLYVGGQFDTAGGVIVHNIAEWNGSNWSALGSGVGLNSDSNGVYALTVYNGSLYAGGNFSTAGGISASNIAKWTVPVGINELSHNNIAEVFPNPSTGVFTFEVKNNTEKTDLQVYNTLGENIYSETLRQAQGDSQIDLSNQPAGIYLYRLLSEDGNLLASGKLVIE
jgi:hypothetical protein